MTHLEIVRRSAATIVIGLALFASGAAQGPVRRAPELLAKDGQAALDGGRYRDAFDAFSGAAQARPRDVSLYVGAAYAASMLGQGADAQRWLERALQIDPRHAPASLLLGQVLFRQGKVADAVAVLEASLTYSPDNLAVTQQLDEWRKDSQLQGRFYESRGAHFSVLFEGPADDAVARNVVAILERAYYRVGAALMTYPSRTTTVLLYTQQQFQDVTRSPSWAGGIYDGRIKLPAGGASQHPDELQRVAEHELVHAVVSTMAGPVVPTWLHEGLAMTLETGGGAWADDVLAGTATRVPLTSVSRGFLGMDAQQATLAYAQSVFAVKKMIAMRGMPAVVSLIQDLGRGATFDRAFERAMFMRFAEFDAMVTRADAPRAAR